MTRQLCYGNAQCVIVFSITGTSFDTMARCSVVSAQCRSVFSLRQVLNVAGVPPCRTAETVWNYILTSSSVKKNKITLDSEFVKKQLNFWGSKSFSESSHLLSYQIWLVNARSEGVHCTYGQNSRNMYYGNKQG
jgi:hypothetical protein